MKTGSTTRSTELTHNTADGESTPDPTVPSWEQPDEIDDGEGDGEDPTEGKAEAAEPLKNKGNWRRILVYGILPAIALLLALGDGCLKWQDSTLRSNQATRAESVTAATEGTVALLSYRADTVDKDLNAARDRLTGNFQNAYTSLIHDVVIPGAKQKQISATATVAGSASVSATENQAVVLVFVNQSLNIGNDPPTETASSLRVTLDKIGNRWLISGFDPI